MTLFRRTLAICSLCSVVLICDGRETGNQIFQISGYIDDKTVVALVAQLDSGKRPLLLMKNSGGGSISSGLALGFLIDKYRLSTAVSGFCNSLCANVYMMGVTRHLALGADPENTNLLFHGVYDKNSRRQSVDVDYQRQLIRKFRENTSGKFPLQLIEKFLDTETPSLGMIVYFSPKKSSEGRSYSVGYCDAKGGSKVPSCEILFDYDPLSLGVVSGEAD